MSQLKPEQQRALKQRLHDNPVFAAQFAAFRNSGDMDRAAKHLCIAYQLFTLGNEHAESAYDIAARYGLGIKKIKTTANNLMQSFDAYEKVMNDIVHNGDNPENAYDGFAFDNQILSEVIEAYLSNKEIVIKRGPYLAPTLFLPSKQQQ